MHRGRKGSVPSELIINTIVKYKKDMLINNKIVSKTASIWQKISEELSNNGQIKATSLYTFVLCNRYNLHELLGIKFSKIDARYLCNKDYNENIQSINSSSNDSLMININDEKEFTIILTQKEYQSLLDTKVYGKRTCVRFKSGEWEDI